MMRARAAMGFLLLLVALLIVGCRSPLYLEELEGMYLVEVREGGDVAIGDDFAAYQLVKDIQPPTSRSVPITRRIRTGRLKVVGFLDSVHAILKLVDGSVEAGMRLERTAPDETKN